MWLYYTARKTVPNQSWSYAAPFMLAGIFAIAGLILVRWVLKDYKKEQEEKASSSDLI
jgi:hypothetical protein